ncbi:hypothetical protein ABZX12_19990 [Kribbella sp. NPDC003505]|uniref:hypothetical protein n=1 Tax=Kribbella sp. NPDC003505 TaxID=3154448 RepID=UPI0033A8DDEF
MGHKRKTEQHQAFADVVEEVRASAEVGGEPLEIWSPIRDLRLVDESGVLWRMRGGELRWSRLEHLVRDPAVPVLHVYLDEVKEVPTAERENLVATVRPYLRTSGDGRAPGDHTEFVAAEFKADDQRSLVVVEEYC